MRPSRRRMLGCWLLLCCALPACAVRHARNRPLLSRLDAALPEAESTAGRAALGTLILPLTIPAGLVDTFLANPALQTRKATRDTFEVLWKDPEGTLFYQSALFLPKVAATPVMFVSEWLFLSVVGPGGEESNS